VLAENRLFSTLDPVTRRIMLPSGRELLLSDTVGFIQKLPPAVVAAFRATLEEVEQSDLLLHVVDATHLNAHEQEEVVNGILEDMGLGAKPRIMVYNKIDLLPEERPVDLLPLGSDTESVSAVTGEGIDELLQKIDATLESLNLWPMAREA
jgi:GTP-binding protein HflX